MYQTHIVHNIKRKNRGMGTVRSSLQVQVASRWTTSLTETTSTRLMILRLNFRAVPLKLFSSLLVPVLLPLPRLNARCSLQSFDCSYSSVVVVRGLIARIRQMSVMKNDHYRRKVRSSARVYEYIKTRFASGD